MILSDLSPTNDRLWLNSYNSRERKVANAVRRTLLWYRAWFFSREKPWETSLFFSGRSGKWALVPQWSCTCSDIRILVIVRHGGLVRKSPAVSTSPELSAKRGQCKKEMRKCFGCSCNPCCSRGFPCLATCNEKKWRVISSQHFPNATISIIHNHCWVLSDLSKLVMWPSRKKFEKSWQRPWNAKKLCWR